MYPAQGAGVAPRHSGGPNSIRVLFADRDSGKMPFLPVVYVPDKPSVSRPLDGEVKDRTFPDLISPDMLAIGGTVMGLVFIGLSALYF